MKLLEELQRKEVDRFSAASEDVVYNVIETSTGLVFSKLLGVAGCVRENGLVVFLQVKVLLGKSVHHRVNLNNGRVDAVRNKRRGCGADSETTTHISIPYYRKYLVKTYMTRALAALSATAFSVLMSLTASSMANTP